jgi:DNA-binding SARP family transcriptional activator
LRELPDIAPNPTVLILDDFHVADGSGDVSFAAKALITQAPERLTIVISSRRTPEVPVGRLRAQGELAELRTRDLQFSESEIADLFSANEGQPLDRESLGLLNRRSEGWAASLQLVRTAVRDRSQAEVREFIKGLTGDQTELYDYLAEEVVGDLRPAHQEFLMKTSLLQTVTVGGAAAITGEPPDQASAQIEQSERLGLLSKQGTAARGYRYHPLVREFLEARLRATVGPSGIRTLHKTAGSWATDSDWRAACYHYEAAQDAVAIHRVLDGAIDVISGQGGYDVAADYLRRFKPTDTTSSFEIIGSRVDYRRGRFESALDRARRAVELRPDSDAALNNSITVHANVGDLEASWELAKQLAQSARSPVYRLIAQASCLRYAASLDGDIDALVDIMEEVAATSEQQDLLHFAGVSHLNLSLAEYARGSVPAGLAHAEFAVAALEEEHRGDELASAYLARAFARAASGQIEQARSDMRNAEEVIPAGSRGEWLVEAADIEVAFGSSETATSLLEEGRATSMTGSMRSFAETVRVRLALRLSDIQRAEVIARAFLIGNPSETPGFTSRQLALQAHVAVRAGASDATERVAAALRFAENQRAYEWAFFCSHLIALQSANPGPAVLGIVRRTTESGLSVIDSLAEDICVRLHTLDDPDLAFVIHHASSRKERWLPALRSVLSDPAADSRWHAGAVLDEIGTQEDVPALRQLARSGRAGRNRSTLGRALARRLAPRFVIDDLGRVEVIADSVPLPASAIRRKVLAMLCYLLTRPRFSATREEVIDALWPDLGPDVALNSLNQTVYFLRRIFEPAYVEDLSATYVHHGPDVLWLDPELVSSRSSRCLRILDRVGAEPSPEDVSMLAEVYTDRFALDFAYEEWAVPFRTSLHVAYLEVVEAAVTRDMATGHEDRAIDLARRALDVDPSVESLELALVRLYRTTGAHAAAAEQYAHYAAVLRNELGLDAPPLSSI